MIEKYKKTCKYLSCIEYLFIFASTVTGCVSISAFVSLVWVPVGITSSAVGIEICATAAGIKKYQSIKEFKNYKIVL